MNLRRDSILSSLDWLSVFTYLILVIFGWINIYSAGYSEAHASMFDLTQQYGKQALWFGFATILAIFTLSIDQRFFETFAYVIYGLCMLVLMSVLVIGIEVNGAKSWIDFGFVRLQPAEISKIGTALALAAWMSRYSFDIKKKKDFGTALALLGFPMALILLQNDMGSVLTYTSFIFLFYRRGLNPLYLWMIALAALIFIFVLRYSPLHIYYSLSLVMIIVFWMKRQWPELIIFTSTFIMLYGVKYGLEKLEIITIDTSYIFYILILSNTSYWLIKSYLGKYNWLRLLSFIAFGAFAFATSVSKVFGLLGDYQQNRILALLGLKSDPFGVEYHVIQSLIAIGSGGLSGKGYLQGTQTKFDFVPEQTTDFIFSTIGEEFGFVGTFGVIALYLFLMLRLLYIAERQRSSFSKNYGYALIGILFLHFTINIGMVTGIGPVIGVPLPFISYGGSSLWSFTLLLFIFLKMDARRMDILGD